MSIQDFDNPPCVLFVEDEPKLGASVRKELMEQGYEVDLAFDGSIGERLFKSKSYDIVLLDINLPHINGLELCKRIRETDQNVPIIMVTALGELDDKMEAFASGADDFLVKPFHLRELLARLKVFLKRRQLNNAFEEKITVADLEIEFSTKTVSRAGKTINLTAKEFSLLALLTRSRGRVLSKNEIAEKVWDTDLDSTTSMNTIEVYISFLRNKIDKEFEPKLIHTKPGFGYFLKPL
ncbi:MAG TPA: response regulator transcription factor [Saprospiraceae bacterium]|nr:response regulator transcription factor [Saprospiraceae bacterium]